MKVPRAGSIFNESRPMISTLALVLIGLILFGLLIIDNINKGVIKPVGAAPPLPTRNALSYSQEGQAYFDSGDLDKAIAAYQEGLAVDPENVTVLTELARLQTYSASLLTPERKKERLLEALDNINLAVELDDFDSDAHAVRAFVLNWNAGQAQSADERDQLLTESSKAANKAILLDVQNALAIAYRAETLADQLQIAQALQAARIAISLEPNLMDTHRVYAYVLESTAEYSEAIREYKIAAEIMPNLTFLYISIGLNYRQLNLYNEALEYFDRAATINSNLGIKDPLPYIAIGKTYSRQGEFFIAARNVERALEFDPTNPDIYGQLGVIRFRARNYEGSIPVFACAVEGCVVYEDPIQGIMIPENDEDREEMAGLPAITVPGLALTNESVVYYYTYGSVLAALKQCEKALPILNLVQEQYANDDLIMSIIQESFFICSAE